jgi:ArsR family metal-binding transcriptional regulator
VAVEEVVFLKDGALIMDYDIELCNPACHRGASVWSAKACLSQDASAVMPYLNAVLERAVYDQDNHYLIWKEGGRKYALRPQELAVSLILDREQAVELVEKAVAEINRVWERRTEITPDHSRRTPPRLLDILKLLPRTNCGACGLQSCMAFAAELVEGTLFLEDCPPLAEDREAMTRLEELGL